MGAPYDDALLVIIQARYPDSLEACLSVLQIAERTNPVSSGLGDPLSEREAPHLKMLVCTVFVNENGALHLTIGKILGYGVVKSGG